MKKHHMNPILTGLATGAVIGTGVYMMTQKSHHNAGKTIRKSTGKALKTVGNVIENMSYMVK